MAEENKTKENVFKKIAEIVVAFLQAVFGQINKLKSEKDKVQLDLDKNVSHEAIDKDAADRGADALLDDAIRAGGGDPQKPESGSE